jgi:two-component system, LytTR family, response regulator
MNNKAISVLIVDDEPAARQVIGHFLAEEDDFEVVGEAGDGDSALKTIEKLKPQIVFLDIEIPEISGIELLHRLTEPLPTIVFITAFNKYAVKAFDDNALDYILKPFDHERFRKSLNRIRKQLHPNTDSPIQSLDEVLRVFEKILNKKGDSKFLKKISCKQKGKIRFIAVEDIIWIESEGAFCKVYLNTGFELTNLSIKMLEELLDPNTHIRVHKSHMVNIDKIESIEPYFHGEYMINMQGGKALKLSRGYKERIQSILNQFK